MGRGCRLTSRRGLKVQVLRADIRRRSGGASTRPTAPSSSTTPRPSTTATAAFRSRRTTSPASTPTPAPLPCSAPAATPTSPAASTSGIPCSSTARQAAKNARRGRCDTINVRHDQRLPPVPHRRATRGRRVSIRFRATAGSGGTRAVPAAVRGQDGAGVRSPRRQCRSQSRTI